MASMIELVVNRFIVRWRAYGRAPCESLRLEMTGMAELVVLSAWLGVRGARGRCEARVVFWVQIVKTGSRR